MKNVIYKIRNITNGHFYIGSTVDSRKRFWEHRKHLRLGTHVCIYLQRAWNKYGEDFFKFEVVEQLASKDELFPAEQRLLDEHFGKDYCYNVAAYADAPMRDASPELRQKLAEKTRAWHQVNQHPRLGIELTPEAKEQIRQSRIGKHAGSDHYRYGRTVSPEVREKIGAAQRGKPKGPGRRVSLEGMIKIRAAAAAGSYSHWKGKTHRPESKEKMSRSIIAVNPEGEENLYKSITAFRVEYDVTPPTIDRALKSGNPLKKGKLKGWSFRYVDAQKEVLDTPQIQA